MKKIVFISILSVLFFSCKSTSTSVSKKEKNENKSLVYKLIKTATDHLGAPYKAAGTTKNGFDCSGLVFTTFALENIKLPRSSYKQSKIGKIISLQEAEKGDLIFFRTNKSKSINHVGLITEINAAEIKFVHSSTSKGVIISSTKEPYYKNSFVQINRIIGEINPLN